MESMDTRLGSERFSTGGPGEEPSTFDARRRQCDVDRACRVNVGPMERLASVAAGSALAAYGLFRAQRGRLLLAGLGAALAGRGMTGRCRVYQALGVDSAHARRRQGATVIPANQGRKVEESIAVRRPAAELYAFWRNLENLPRVMRDLKRVEVIDSQRSHWVADGAMGRDVAWDAEIFNDRANETIAWRSLPGGDIATAGSVHFHALDDDRGTEVVVSLKYDPPAGKLGAWITELFCDGLQQRIADDLREFKRIMETGETPAEQGGRRSRAVD